jgi:hypothetical protein
MSVMRFRVLKSKAYTMGITQPSTLFFAANVKRVTFLDGRKEQRSLT